MTRRPLAHPKRKSGKTTSAGKSSTKPRQRAPKPLKKKIISKNKPWFVYVIQAENGALYTGITTDVARRFDEHATKKRGARFFHMQTPVEVMWTEKHPTRSSALKREAAIKAMKREEKKLLLRG